MTCKCNAIKLKINKWLIAVGNYNYFANISEYQMQPIQPGLS